jgi:hypothetical protein
MLPKDDMLRRLPNILEPRQRLRLEGLVFCADAIDLAMHTLTNTGARLREDEQFGSIEMNAMIAAAWTIVDRVDLARCILNSLVPEEQRQERVKVFLELSQTAKGMRNYMDHLDQRIGNIAARKDPVAPVFGSLSYLLIRDGDFERVGEERVLKGGKTVTVVPGVVGPKGHAIPMINPATALAKCNGEVVSAASRFELSMLEYTLDLSEAAGALGNVLREMSIAIGRNLKTEAEALAKTSGQPVEKLLGHPAAGLTIALAFQAKPPSGEASELG